MMTKRDEKFMGSYSGYIESEMAKFERDINDNFVRGWEEVGFSKQDIEEMKRSYRERHRAGIKTAVLKEARLQHISDMLVVAGYNRDFAEQVINELSDKGLSLEDMNYVIDHVLFKLLYQYKGEDPGDFEADLLESSHRGIHLEPLKQKIREEERLTEEAKRESEQAKLQLKEEERLTEEAKRESEQALQEIKEVAAKLCSLFNDDMPSKEPHENTQGETASSPVCSPEAQEGVSQKENLERFSLFNNTLSPNKGDPEIQRGALTPLPTNPMKP